MYMFMCMYVCMHVSICVCVYVCTYLIYLYVGRSVSIYIYIERESLLLWFRVLDAFGSQLASSLKPFGLALD